MERFDETLNGLTKVYPQPAMRKQLPRTKKYREILYHVKRNWPNTVCGEEYQIRMALAIYDALKKGK